MMEVVVTTGAISRAKLQSNRYQQQTNTQHFTGQMPSCRPTNIFKALKGNIFVISPVRSFEYNSQNEQVVKFCVN